MEECRARVRFDGVLDRTEEWPFTLKDAKDDDRIKEIWITCANAGPSLYAALAELATYQRYRNLERVCVLLDQRCPYDNEIVVPERVRLETNFANRIFVDTSRAAGLEIYEEFSPVCSNGQCAVLVRKGTEDASTNGLVPWSLA